MNASASAAQANRIESVPDFETIFRTHYERISRVIVRVVHDPARAEELAVEVFWRFWRKAPRGENPNEGGWLYRTAVRMALDELRKQARRTRHESNALAGSSQTPEEVRAASEERDLVRGVLATIEPRQAELLLLRSDGLSYAEIASALELNPSSIGTLISRAQQAFRKEYVRKYGQPQSL